MHLPEQEQCFDAFKIGNGHVWQLDSDSFVIDHYVAYQLVLLLGNYVHWLCEMSNLHIPTCDSGECGQKVDKSTRE